MPDIDREYIYRLTFNKNWSELLTLAHQHSRLILSDESLKIAIQNFEDQFFRELEEDAANHNVRFLLEKLFLLHKGRIYQLSDDRYHRTVVELVRIYVKEGLTKKSYEYAQYYPSDEMCAEIIAAHEEPLPKVLKHSQSDQIKAVESVKVANVNYTTSLFKSRQEVEFFRGVKDVFQMFVVYPNVALSCVIDFEKVKDSLSQDERSFFFRGIIDCVVFDQDASYKPIKFFELDSVYHDSPEQQQKDAYKNRILSLAGQKLLRIRGTLGKNPRREEFARLIKEVSG